MPKSLRDKPTASEFTGILKTFFADIREWERKASRKVREGATEGLGSERLAVIARHCTPKRRVYSGGAFYSIPSRYAADLARVIEVKEESPRRVRVFTQKRTPSGVQYCYVLIKQGGRWLIDNRQWLNGSKWERDVL